MSNQHIPSLYRSYLRQVRALPHVYLRHFFRIKGGDDFRSLLKSKSMELRRSQLRRVSSDLRRLRAANSGKSTAFDRMLDIAYGRAGKLRRELMESLLSDSNAPLPAREENTCLPVYSPELAALLTSGISRTTRPLQIHHLVSPPGLPGRAEANSEQSVLVGSPSGRREYNIRWRFFKSESKKVLPPLQVSLQHATHTPSHLSNFGFRDTTVLQELLELAGSPSRVPDSPGKQRRLQQIQPMSDTNPFDGSLPIRWLRRRYQALLGRIPLLVSQHLPKNNSKTTYDVQVADSAITTSRPHPSRLRVVDAKDISWISNVHSTTQSKKRCK